MSHDVYRYFNYKVDTYLLLFVCVPNHYSSNLQAPLSLAWLCVKQVQPQLPPAFKPCRRLVPEKSTYFLRKTIQDALIQLLNCLIVSYFLSRRAFLHSFRFRAGTIVVISVCLWFYELVYFVQTAQWSPGDSSRAPLPPRFPTGPQETRWVDVASLLLVFKAMLNCTR